MGGLTCDESIRPGLLFPPRWYEHCDVFVATFEEPVHCKLNTLARKHLLVAMAAPLKRETECEKIIRKVCLWKKIRS